MEPFVHLHVHSQFSLLDGQAAINDLVDKAIADGMPGIALTDHGAMFGIKEFYNYVEKKNSGHNATLKDCRRELDQLNDSKSADMLTDEERNRIVKLQQKIEETKNSSSNLSLGVRHIVPDVRDSTRITRYRIRIIPDAPSMPAVGT